MVAILLVTGEISYSLYGKGLDVNYSKKETANNWMFTSYTYIDSAGRICTAVTKLFSTSVDCDFPPEGFNIER